MEEAHKDWSKDYEFDQIKRKSLSEIDPLVKQLEAAHWKHAHGALISIAKICNTLLYDTLRSSSCFSVNTCGKNPGGGAAVDSFRDLLIQLIYTRHSFTATSLTSIMHRSSLQSYMIDIIRSNRYVSSSTIIEIETRREMKGNELDSKKILLENRALSRQLDLVHHRTADYNSLDTNNDTQQFINSKEKQSKISVPETNPPGP